MKLCLLAISVGEALQLALTSSYRCWPVCDDRGVVGVLSKRGLERAANEHGMAKQLSDLVDAQTFPHLHADQSLQMALERMGGARLDLLPVVSRADVHKLEGVVLLRDVLDSYGIGAENED